jgi:DNA-binding NtrC family response regulator
MGAAVREGRFREDLYYRLLATATLELPPLRDRPGDVALLLGQFAAREARRLGAAPLRFGPEALAAVERHSFPGNVRELERLVAGLLVRAAGRRVEVEDLPAAVRGASPGTRGRASLAQARLDFERGYLIEVLERHRGNRTHAARSAGVARQTLVALLKRHGLERPAGEGRAPRPRGAGGAGGEGS